MTVSQNKIDWDVDAAVDLFVNRVKELKARQRPFTCPVVGYAPESHKGAFIAYLRCGLQAKNLFSIETMPLFVEYENSPEGFIGIQISV